ncbi:hypothetical protein BH93_11470 [Rhodococcoides fascians A25f]|uniref:hypothetical protein n=1 Tax=Rhodococcoides fascians TaxID=1828 RepID=UPI0012D36E85|nr:hypothetical protein [Rhodococcus fascians]QII05909.1 hypothetical protein BH93_11470 [Rhodococcus fascians A25f]
MTIDELTNAPVVVTRDVEGKRLRIVYGSSSISLDLTEAVDLVDALATVLATIPTPEEWTSKELARDEQRVRADAEVRESL